MAVIIVAAAVAYLNFEFVVVVKNRIKSAAAVESHIKSVVVVAAVVKERMFQ